MPTPTTLSLGLDLGGTSSKLVWLDDTGEVVQRSQTAIYADPSRVELADTIRAGLLEGNNAGRVSAVGVCVPGQFEPDLQTVRYAANLSALCGMHVPSFVSMVTENDSARVSVHADAEAAAIGTWHRDPVPGRLLALSMGTGVGAAVLDDGDPITIGPATAGHLGQIDVSLTDDAPIGPDGGRGSLEAYIGLPALRARFGEGVAEGIRAMGAHDPALRALARAVRIAHAIYSPNVVRFLGGIGIAFKPRLVEIKRMVDTDLTAVADPDWTLRACDDTFLAAYGAAVSATRSDPG